MEAAAESSDLLRALLKKQTGISFQTREGDVSTGILTCTSRDVERKHRK